MQGEMYPLNLIPETSIQRGRAEGRTMRFVRTIFAPVLSLVVSALWLLACAPAATAKTQPEMQVFLVRHAEKTTGDDPALTAEGQARAQQLAQILRNAEIMRIHSSDTRRTRDTAAPLADLLGIEVELYDPRDLPTMAAKLQAAGGQHLVVGHSNTTGELAELLGGEGGAPIVEAYEYDRLYVVTRSKDGRVSSLMLRFGESGL